MTQAEMTDDDAPIIVTTTRMTVTSTTTTTIRTPMMSTKINYTRPHTVTSEFCSITSVFYAAHGVGVLSGLGDV